MAQPGRKKARVAAGPSGEGPMPVVRRAAAEAARVLIPVGVVALVYVYGSSRLWALAEKRPECTIEDTRWKDEKALRPPWLRAGDVAAINDLGAPAKGRSVFEPGLGKMLAAEYARNPWVERVDAVRCSSGTPARLHVDLKLRVPYAVLTGADGKETVVDRAGTAVPLAAADAAKLHLPAVELRSRVRLSPGERLADRVAADALAGLAMVQDHLAAFPRSQGVRIARVAADRSGERTALAFVTMTGARLEWGEFTDDPSWGEPTTREKMELLDARIREIRDWRRVEYVRLNTKAAPMKLKE